MVSQWLRAGPVDAVLNVVIGLSRLALLAQGQELLHRVRAVGAWKGKRNDRVL
jgi:hypothetical protein